MKLVLAAALAGYALAADYEVEVACADDNAVKITIPYDREAELLNFKAGTCNETNKNVRYDQDDTSHEVVITVDMRACGMRADGKVRDRRSDLRTIIFDNTADVTLGRSITDDLDAVTYTSKIKLECGVEDNYVVSLDYGKIDADYSGDDGFQGGEKKYTFEIASMDKNFTKAANISNRAGDQVYLAVSSPDVPFEFYKFGLVKCTFNETDGNKTVTSYDLFNVDGPTNCTNDFLDFSIAYNTEENRYQFSHTVFTFDPTRENTYSLTCNIKLCDFSIEDSVAKCNAVEKACGIDSIGQNCGDGETWENGKCNKDVDGKWGAWTKGSCSVTCGKGQVTKSRKCEGRAFGGKACEGEVSENDTCDSGKTCPKPVDGVWGNWTKGACSVTCGFGQVTKTRTCEGQANGGKACDGKAVDIVGCDSGVTCTVTNNNGTRR